MASDTGASVPAEAFNNLPYHYYSNFYAPSVLATSLINALCLGVVLFDSCVNVRFDLYLVRSSGWRRPIKIINRLSYFSVRLLVILYLVLMTCYLNLESKGDCSLYFRSIFVIWYMAIALIDIIFLTRTLALYEWHRLLTIGLVSLYCAYVGLALHGISRWGHAFRLGATQFCSYASEVPTPSYMERQFKAFFALTTFFDVVILVLTCKRLAAQDDGATRQTSRLSRTLFIQGFILYGSLLTMKLAFIFFHYLTDYRQSWILFGMGLGVTTAYITASILVRQTSNVVQQQATCPTFNSSQNGARQSQNAELFAQPISIVVEKQTVDDTGTEGADGGYVFAPTLPK
jgi:hypothetical protein